MIPGSPVPVQVERASRGATPYISPVRLLARAGEVFCGAIRAETGSGSGALAGSALHAFDVKDCDRARLQSNPSPSSKIS